MKGLDCLAASVAGALRAQLGCQADLPHAARGELQGLFIAPRDSNDGTFRRRK